MGLFSKKVAYPPTPFGFQPTPQMDVRSWACANPSCDAGEHAPDPRSWPKKCPTCGAGIASGVISGVGSREAERAEIDYRLAHPESSSYGESFWRHKDVMWKYEDAALRQDATTARSIRSALNEEELALGRSEMTGVALRCDLIDEAAELIEPWFEDTDFKDRAGPSVGRINALSRHAIDFMKSPQGQRHPAAERIWTQLATLMAAASDVTRYDADNDFAELARQRSL